jgi:hypothetical protein
MATSEIKEQKKATRELRAFMKTLEGKEWQDVKPVGETVARKLVELGFKFKRPQVWEMMAQDTGEGDGGVCCEYVYDGHLLDQLAMGMVVLEWVRLANGNYRITGGLV